MKDDKTKTEQKKRSEDMLLDIMPISELFNETQQLRAQIIELLESDNPDAIEKIQALENEQSMLNEKLTNLMDAFEKKYPIADKEWDYDDRIKKA